MLQTIIMFAGIITFLFGTINIFSNNSQMNLSQLIVNTIGLGIILVLFTGLSITIAPILTNMVPLKKLFKSFKFWFSVVLLLIYAIAVFTNYKVVQDLNSSIKVQKLEELIRTSTKDNLNIVENDSIIILSIEK